MSDRRKPPKSARVRKFPAWCRRDVEEAIERLLAILDAADPDPDLEANGDDEPSLGGGTLGDDREFDPSETEPSLGSTHEINQEIAWRGARWVTSDDLEFDGETRESADSEPSLGSANFAGPQMMLVQPFGILVIDNGDQTHWGRTYANDDREIDDAEDAE